MTNYMLRHLQAFLYSLGQLYRSPLASLLSVAALSAALFLPCAFYVLVKNIDRLSVGWDTDARISVFLKKQTSDRRIKELKKYIQDLPAVQFVEYMSPDQALEEYKALTGFASALGALKTNPLPPVFIVTPYAATETAKIDALAKQLAALVETDQVELDLDWLRRLHALSAFVARLSILAATLMGIGAMLIVGNTIRLAVINRRREIEVLSLVGGTPAFIRRPYIYSGVLQGLFGALGALLTIQISLWVIYPTISSLTIVYGSNFYFTGLSLRESALLLVLGAILGGVAARMTAGLQLRQVNPTF